MKAVTTTPTLRKTAVARDASPVALSLKDESWVVPMPRRAPRSRYDGTGDPPCGHSSSVRKLTEYRTAAASRVLECAAIAGEALAQGRWPASRLRGGNGGGP